MGADVWEPFARNNQIDRASAGWAYRIGQADLRDVREADGLFAVVNGCPPDEGVMVELGTRDTRGRSSVFLFRDDFRWCTDSEMYPLSMANENCTLLATENCTRRGDTSPAERTFFR